MLGQKNYTLRFLFLLLLLVCGTYRTNAQERDSQLWSAFILDYNFSQNWLFELETDYNRLLSDGPVWRELAFQPSIEYYLNRSIELFAGTYISGIQQNDLESSREIRPLTGFRWNIIKPEKRVFLRTQIKFEYRIFTNLTREEDNQSSRLRSRVDLFVPITRTNYGADKNLYMMLWAELFNNFDDNIKERFRNNFRLYAGPGYRLSYNWRFELVYVFQGSRDSISDSQFDTISNVAFFTVKYYVPRKWGD